MSISASAPKTAYHSGFSFNNPTDDSQHKMMGKEGSIIWIFIIRFCSQQSDRWMICHRKCKSHWILNACIVSEIWVVTPRRSLVLTQIAAIVLKYLNCPPWAECHHVEEELRSAGQNSCEHRRLSPRAGSLLSDWKPLVLTQRRTMLLCRLLVPVHFMFTLTYYKLTKRCKHYIPWNDR